VEAREIKGTTIWAAAALALVDATAPGSTVMSINTSDAIEGDDYSMTSEVTGESVESLRSKAAANAKAKETMASISVRVADTKRRKTPTATDGKPLEDANAIEVAEAVEAKKVVDSMSDAMKAKVIEKAKHEIHDLGWRTFCGGPESIWKDNGGMWAHIMRCIDNRDGDAAWDNISIRSDRKLGLAERKMYFPGLGDVVVPKALLEHEADTLDGWVKYKNKRLAPLDVRAFRAQFDSQAAGAWGVFVSTARKIIDRFVKLRRAKDDDVAYGFKLERDAPFYGRPMYLKREGLIPKPEPTPLEVAMESWTQFEKDMYERSLVEETVRKQLPPRLEEWAGVNRHLYNTETIRALQRQYDIGVGMAQIMNDVPEPTTMRPSLTRKDVRTGFVSKLAFRLEKAGGNLTNTDMDAAETDQ